MTEQEKGEAREAVAGLLAEVKRLTADADRLRQRGARRKRERDTARQQLAEVREDRDCHKERAERAEAELADGAIWRAFDKIADSVCPGWEYPGQVVRAVIEEDEQ